MQSNAFACLIILWKWITHKLLASLHTVTSFTPTQALARHPAAPVRGQWQGSPHQPPAGSKQARHSPVNYFPCDFSHNNNRIICIWCMSSCKLEQISSVSAKEAALCLYMKHLHTFRRSLETEIIVDSALQRCIQNKAIGYCFIVPADSQARA